MSGEGFALSPDNRALAEGYIARYPEGRQASAVLPVLDIVQRQNGGWLSPEAVRCVADMLEMPLIRVYEVISFYEMFNAQPVGKHMVRVCTTTPCMLRGSTDILAACKDELGIAVGETTDDDLFTLAEFECLGACVNAPIVWIDDDYYEDLSPERTREILRAFRKGEHPEPGPQTGRQKSAPEGGPRVLADGAPAPAPRAPVPEPEPEADPDPTAGEEIVAAAFAQAPSEATVEDVAEAEEDGEATPEPEPQPETGDGLIAAAGAATPVRDDLGPLDNDSADDDLGEAADEVAPEVEAEPNYADDGADLEIDVEGAADDGDRADGAGEQGEDDQDEEDKDKA